MYPNSALNKEVATWFDYLTLLSHEVDIYNVVYTGNSLRCQDNMLIKLFKSGHHDTIFAISIYQISNRRGKINEKQKIPHTVGTITNSNTEKNIVMHSGPSTFRA